jgi:hypothetical protein
MERISAVKPLPGYRLWVRFTGGTEGEADLSSLVGQGVFAAWNDPAEFMKVSISPKTGTVCWPGGIDLDPDMLYSKVTGKAVPDIDVAA